MTALMLLYWVQNVRLVELLDEARDHCAATIRSRREESGEPIDEVLHNHSSIFPPVSPPSCATLLGISSSFLFFECASDHRSSEAFLCL
jgi:hypothetical protein